MGICRDCEHVDNAKIPAPSPQVKRGVVAVSQLVMKYETRYFCKADIEIMDYITGDKRKPGIFELNGQGKCTFYKEARW